MIYVLNNVINLCMGPSVNKQSNMLYKVLKGKIKQDLQYLIKITCRTTPSNSYDYLKTYNEQTVVCIKTCYPQKRFGPSKHQKRHTKITRKER